jgi:hypothetical protein
MRCTHGAFLFHRIITPQPQPEERAAAKGTDGLGGISSISYIVSLTDLVHHLSMRNVWVILCRSNSLVGGKMIHFRILLTSAGERLYLRFKHLERIPQ